MSIRIIDKESQASGAFNGGEIIENKPIGFPREGGSTKPYSSLFYWANAIAKVDSTIGLHPHEGFEIMSFVLKGKIRHYDTQLQGWKDLYEGDAQIIRAGNGISHSEYMAKGSRMFQIWLDPNLNKTMLQGASYDDYSAKDIPTSTEGSIEVLHYAGSKGIMHMDTANVNIEKWKLNGQYIAKDSNEVYSIYVLNGEITINGQRTNVDDFIIAENENFVLEGQGELFVIRTAQNIEYATYGELMQKRI